MRTDLLVTGFGPFLSVRENPSSLLAAGSGLPFELLEVSFEAVDGFLSRLQKSPPRRLMMIGVAGSADRFRLERTGRNKVAKTPDVRGVVRGPGPIDPNGPPKLRAKLWNRLLPTPSDPWVRSENAGSYLCNYAMYRAIQCLEETRVGFLHVPSLEVWDIERQRTALSDLLSRLPGNPRLRRRA